MHDFPPFLRVFTDGHVQRLITIPHLPPSTDPLTGIQLKDVVISPKFRIKSRIFLPNMSPPQKLPLIIYVHGGAFCFGSPLNVVTHSFLTPLVSQTSAVAIAFGYRLAPEHPLPAAYHDCWAALQWIASHVSGAGPDPWINNYVDTTLQEIGPIATTQKILFATKFRACNSLRPKLVATRSLLLIRRNRLLFSSLHMRRYRLTYGDDF
ncbi:putative carboxylesterase [Helianthus annuus]|uniref:Carboxylesterase n=1 Tax=Helianthus annuus TaxID=4232 RepID=A0A251VAD8_HELAN|nr:putative carboxylesterase [Helianthus annuus]KAJ0593520.1 putative carboxylesterase [Helianthus annuus]KAJ0608532.1 putative carboxylesterase [Helianthus annuus]KAJ0768597.1 putative carboxylesterase [Helianthus annuus]KAJ0774342.1 putative carboxylesterase [Helianthus annuus]